MEVRFTNERMSNRDSQCTANILWERRYPMYGGRFPGNHPVKDEQIKAFRARGYWASCFPEGDGITFYSESGPRPDADVIADIETCFDFTVKRPAQAEKDAALPVSHAYGRSKLFKD